MTIRMRQYTKLNKTSLRNTMMNIKLRIFNYSKLKFITRLIIIPDSLIRILRTSSLTS